MSLISWSNEKIKRMNVWNIGILKIMLAIFGMIIGAYFPEFVKANLRILIAIFVVLWLIIATKFFKK
jgi:putative Mn2+ efflux pump MntP